MNLLDKAISVVAPRVALQRARSRVALELTTGYLERHAQRFRYDGAAAGRRSHGWYAASTDANVELMGSLIWLRNRSRDLIRNNPYAARAVEELAGNVVGNGGVQADLDAATSVADDAATRIAKPSNLPSGAYFLLIDPPLSVLGDTISLPYTIYQLARKGY